MKQIPILLLGFILFGCKASKQNNITIFYFKYEFSSPVSIDCNNMLEESDILKVEINDNNLYKFINENKSNPEYQFSD